MRLYILAIACVSLLITFTSFNAAAEAEINDEGAVKLKAIITELLEQQQNAYEFAGGEMRLDGSVTVEQADNYYAITVPPITSVNPEGGRNEIGMIAINARPGDAPEEWKMSIAIPTPILYFNEAGDVKTQVDIGAQRMAGVWNEQLHSFSRMDAAYENVKVENFTKGETALISNLVINMDLQKEEGNLWSGPMEFTASNITIDKSLENETIVIEKFVGETRLMNYSPEVNRKMQEKIEALTENTNAQDLANMSEDEQIAFYNMFFDMLKTAGGGFTSNFIAQNITHRQADGDSDEKIAAFQIDKLGFGLDMTGFDEGNANLGLRMGIEEIEMVNQAAEISGYLPNTMNIDVSINNLPLDALQQAGLSSLKSAKDNPNAASVGAVQMIMTLPHILSDAGTNITIKDTYIKSREFDADLEGVVAADSQSRVGAIGSLTAVITGLDTAIARIQEEIKTASDSQKQKLQKMLTQMTIISALGQAGENEDGKQTKTFEFVMGEDGKFLLNGTDMSAMLGILNAPGLPAQGTDQPKEDTPAKN